MKHTVEIDGVKVTVEVTAPVTVWDETNPLRPELFVDALRKVRTLEEVKRAYVAEVLALCHGDYAMASKALGIHEGAVSSYVSAG